MKKYIFLFIAATFILTSCNSDDDSTPSEDQFIGTWVYNQRFAEDVETSLDACDKQITIEIKSDGTAIYSEYVDVDGSCEFDGTYSELWKSLGDNKYTITEDAGTDEEDIYNYTLDGNKITTEFFNENDSENVKEVYIRQ